MATKSRLEVGVDVPWVTSWTDEAVLGVRPCASLGGGLAIHQAERAGYGRPNYSRNHLDRQRWSVRRMLCPMCGAPTAADDRWTQTGRLVAAGVLRARGLGAAVPADVADAVLLLNAGAIAPLHRACAERALQHCPHLGALPSTELLAFPHRMVVLPLTVAAQPTHALAAQPGTPVAVVSFLQLCGVTGETDRKWRRGLRDPG